MVVLENVSGSEELAVPIIFQKDTVYIKSNIRKNDIKDPETGDVRVEYIWDETQMSYPEYVEVLQKENNELSTNMSNLESTTDLILTDIIPSLIG